MSDLILHALAKPFGNIVCLGDRSEVAGGLLQRLLAKCLQLVPVLLPKLLRSLRCLQDVWLARQSAIHHLSTQRADQLAERLTTDHRGEGPVK